VTAKTRLEFCAFNDYRCKAHFSCALCNDLWNAATGAAVERFTSTNSVRDAIVALYGRWATTVGKDSDHTQVDNFVDWMQQQHP